MSWTEKIEQLRNLGYDWDSHGARAPTEEAVKVIEYLAVCPLPSGGLQLEVHANGWDVELEFSPEGEPVGVSMERRR